MSDTEAVLIFLGVAFWLGLGGWAFGTLLHSGEENKDDPNLGGILIFCLFLAPVTAGLAIAWMQGEKIKTKRSS